MDDVPEKLIRTPNAPLQHMHVRIDMARNTKLLVTKNVNGWPHITVGDWATLIMHPHFAKRLMASLAAVLDGEEFTHG